jgi:hypothetical protein
MLRHWSQQGDDVIATGDVAAARIGVGCHLQDAVALGRLRGIAAELAEGIELSRCDEHQLADLLCAALIGDRLRLGWQALPVLRPLIPVRRPSSGAPTPPATNRTREAAPAAAAATAESTLGADVDVAAMVDSLQRAARDGVPFCEECTRTAQRAAETAA